MSASRPRTRLRLGFALLAAALFVPAALLVERALRGVAAEQEARHRAVAERVFDEMERALSELVAREEARPTEAWDASAADRLRALPEEPFVLGYFELAPDGRLRAPLPPRDPAALTTAAAWFAAHDQRAARDAAPAPAAGQAPGTTVPLGKSAPPAPRAEAPASGQAEDAYEALRSLNLGAAQRAERQRKLVAPVPGSAPSDARDAESPRDAIGRAGREAAAPGTPPAPRRVAIDPLIGRLADARTLLLYRSVFGARALRQGLVLDVEGLGAWLRARALAAGRVAGAELRFAPAGAPAPGVPAGADGFRYRHRFAEPFDGLDAALVLPALAGPGGAGPLHALAALLAATGAAGLFALYRMAALAMAVAERRSRFAAAVTHELRTPVTAIRLYGEMLRDDLVPGEAKRREYYRTITAEAERLGRLVDDVLQLARLERQAGAPPLASAPLGPLVEEALALLRPQAERAGFALAARIDPDLPPVRLDRDAVLQVLGNLVDNALKYGRDAERSERAIEVACRRDAGRVVLAVRDRGPGVPRGELPLLFEPFRRGAGERVRAAPGTGLGLALVQRLVERMGGRVEARNAAGGGLEVRVALPAAGGG